MSPRFNDLRSRGGTTKEKQWLETPAVENFNGLRSHCVARSASVAGAQIRMYVAQVIVAGRSLNK